MSTNGSNRVLWFLLMALTTIVLALVGAWAMQINNHAHDNEQRITRIEARFIEEIAKMNGKVDSLGVKLDNLIEQSRQKDDGPHKRPN